MEMLQQVFEGHEFGLVEMDGQAWFEAAAIAKALGYRDTFNLTRNLDPFMLRGSPQNVRAEEDEKGTHNLSAPDRVMVSEAGLYYALTVSRRPQAEAWRMWLFGDLLPTLRRTGFYSLREAVVTAQAIARAYGVATKNIPYYMEAHGITPIGHAENPDTGKPVSLYPRAAVLEKFMLGSGMRDGFELRAYSGAWDRVPQALAG